MELTRGEGRERVDLPDQAVRGTAGENIAGELNFVKLVWIFLVCAFLGDLLETLYCRLAAGVWMSRSSVIYGMFSIVWGLGAAFLTVILHHRAGERSLRIFLAGFVLGGIYEYLCSLFTELCFGTIFWDYSQFPLQIGGRTNLPFCVCWGAAALVWIGYLYPVISRAVDRIPPAAGRLLTWTVLALLVLDMGVSTLAMIRYRDRKAGIQAETVLEDFLDRQFEDELLEWIWPDMRIVR